MHIPSEPQPNQPCSARWGADVVRCLRAFRLMSSAYLKVTTLPGGTTAEPRQTVGGATGSARKFPWRVSVVVNDGVDPIEVNVTVDAGLRVAIGGDPSLDGPFELTLTEEQYDAGVWIIKQFSNTLNTWIEDVQVLPADEINAESPHGLSDEGEDHSIEVKPTTAEKDEPHDHDTEFLIWPDTLKRQRRVIAFVSRQGILQYAVGSIYVVGKPGEPVEEEDVPEDEADGECDQNDHPGDDEYGGDDPEGPDNDDDEDDHPGEDDETDPDEDDEDAHPADEDCYTTT